MEFGEYIKSLRCALGLTLREFCLRNGFDPGNYSRIERGRCPAPQKRELLEKYAAALECVRDSDEWLMFFDLAATSRGAIPSDLLADDELMSKLPVLFRTLRGSKVDPGMLDHIVDKVRNN